MTVAGVVSSVKTKTTKNNSLMAYVDLEDATGSMELMVFSRVLAECGHYLKAGLPVAVTGRVSQRDEKAPQIMADWVGPLSQEAQSKSQKEESDRGDTLWIRLPDGEGSLVWLKKLLNMFPGRERTVVYLQDSGKKLLTACLHHTALLEELKEKLGIESVVLR